MDILGVVVDADTDYEARWTSLRNILKENFPKIPTHMPPGGLCLEGSKRVGVWIMPNNGATGMLETFMSSLIPNTDDPIWKHARKSVDKAVKLGAECKALHSDKSNIHTWLAWHDPPGQGIGRAVMRNCFNCEAEMALKFVAWFKELYQIS
ncbi:hypothetical protein QMO75_05295 [Rhodomicrobium lacus]|nr:DUF3226 domain-containing protein [Rhodomicrobium lacus]WKW51896.1 hypothetical protein QMO75_05295 [Rhodomicrobium lacus]